MRSRCESDAGCYPDSRLQDLYINVLEFLSLWRFSAQSHGTEEAPPCDTVLKGKEFGL